MIQQIKAFLIALANMILQFLPDSPFQTFYAAMKDIPFLGYLNYFIPIAEMVVILEGWLAAIIVFYAYQLIMRWIRLIE